jgi:hypothetical protein
MAVRVALLLCWSRCWTNQPRIDHRRARKTENQGARRRQAIREKKRAIARSAPPIAAPEIRLDLIARHGIVAAREMAK